MRLSLTGNYYKLPGLICYLDRSHGAAIRRARTRLPGGGDNPVAIIRMPRERMIGSGIASSLVHEVGHQAAALLDLVESIRPLLRGLQRNRRGGEQSVGLLGSLYLRNTCRLLVRRQGGNYFDAGTDGSCSFATLLCFSVEP